MAITEHPLFRLLDTPAQDAAMAGCYIYHDTGPCIDTGVNIYMEGNLTIGLQALREMCEVAGFRFNAEGIELEKRVAELERELEKKDARIAELDQILRDDAVLLGAAQRRLRVKPSEPEQVK